MSSQQVKRTRTLTRAEEPHPVSTLIEQVRTPAPPAQAAERPAPTPPPAQQPAPATDTDNAAKKQVNYRLAPSLINDLKAASIVYSFRQKRQVSQNQIVEIALRDWLDANGPFEL